MGRLAVLVGGEIQILRHIRALPVPAILTLTIRVVEAATMRTAKIAIWNLCVVLSGCLTVAPYETYGFEQLQFPMQEPPGDIGSLVYIEGGKFMLGIPDDYTGAFAENERIVWVQNAMPPVAVTVPSFYLGKYEVTAREFCDFLNDRLAKGEDTTKYVYWDPKGRTTVQFKEQYEPLAGFELAPATSVSYIGARRYCEWLSAETGDNYRLPSEVEWEYAARGSEGRTYPWGEDAPLGRCFLQAHYVNAVPWGSPGLCSVGLFPSGATPEGVHDMVGNSVEWCGNYDFDYENFVSNPEALISPSFYLPELPAKPWYDQEGEPILGGGMLTTTRSGQYLHYESELISTAWSRVGGGSPLLVKSYIYTGFRVLKEIASAGDD